MKKFFVLFALFFLSFVLYPCGIEGHFLFSVWVEEASYSGCYDSNHRVPHFVEWNLTITMIEVETPIRDGSFSWIRDGGELRAALMEAEVVFPNNADYTNTGFDRGHLLPNRDFAWSRASSNATFFMGNVAPQYPKFNRSGGLWYESELAHRKLASEHGEVFIRVTIEEFSGQWTNGSVPIAIPSHFTKEVVWSTGFVIWRLPNEESGGEEDLDFYVVGTTPSQDTMQ